VRGAQGLCDPRLDDALDALWKQRVARVRKDPATLQLLLKNGRRQCPADERYN
jgi:hypothetical protein